ncbi:MAG: hypothetical protein V1755_03120 [Chloroflexota bacterium]
MIEPLSLLAYPSATIGWLAIAAGVAGFAALTLAILSFLFGKPFALFDDVLIGLTALLSAGLGMLLFPEHRPQDEQLAQVGLALSVLGGCVAAFGSVLAATGVANWFLAQLYVAAGNALSGIWLIILNRSAGAVAAFPNGVVTVGIFAGAVMAQGIAAIPGILAGSESERAAPWISRTVGRAGKLGSLVLFPLWCIWLGRALLRL